MKNFLLLFAVIILASCNKMDHYEIIGTIKNVPDNTIINLFEISDNIGSLVASDTIINGQFNFRGTLSNRPSQMNLLAADRLNFAGSCDMWVDYTKVKISGSGNFLSTWNVSSKLTEQHAMNLYAEKTKDQMRKVDSLSLARMADTRNRDFQISIMTEINSISKTILSSEFKILQNNFNSLTALKKLYQIAKFGSIDKKEISIVFNKMDDKYKNTLLGEGILAELNKPVPPKIGDKMIDLNLHDQDGKQYKLSDFSGKYILLDFWSLACYPCILAAPELREINETYKTVLNIIGLSMDVNLKMWKDATKRDSVTWVNLSDGKGTYAGAPVLYGINGFPTYILINPGDTIIERWEGFSNGMFTEKLKPYLTIK